MAILKRTATARAASAAREEAELNKFLSFRMGEENFGIGILVIKEIIEYGAVTAVPMMPLFMRGAINLRGRALPVIDLSVRMGRPPLTVGKRSCIVIVELACNQVRMVVGLMVDAVNEVLDIMPRDIDAAPTFGGSVRTDFLLGMGKVKDHFVMLLDTNNVLSIREIEALGGTADLPVSVSGS